MSDELTQAQNDTWIAYERAKNRMREAWVAAGYSRDIDLDDPESGYSRADARRELIRHAQRQCMAELPENRICGEPLDHDGEHVPMPNRVIEIVCDDARFDDASEIWARAGAKVWGYEYAFSWRTRLRIRLARLARRLHLRRTAGICGPSRGNMTTALCGWPLTPQPEEQEPDPSAGSAGSASEPD